MCRECIPFFNIAFNSICFWIDSYQINGLSICSSVANAKTLLCIRVEFIILQDYHEPMQLTPTLKIFYIITKIQNRKSGMLTKNFCYRWKKGCGKRWKTHVFMTVPLFLWQLDQVDQRSVILCCENYNLFGIMFWSEKNQLKYITYFKQF